MRRPWLLRTLILTVVATSGALPPAAAAEPPTVQAVEQWADKAFVQILADHRVSVLGLAVVTRDRPLLIKGYGYADWATKAPVDVNKTQFRIASITKTFTATAAAQLLERGLIKSLDDPANTYLKRTQLEKSFGEDVTVWDLLTHRAGYEDSGAGRNESELAAPVPASLIAAATPKIVRKRDTYSVYSNFSVSILGILIEDVTGQTLGDYFRDNIFRPLGMTNSLLLDGPQRAPDLVIASKFIAGAPPVAGPYQPINAFTAPAGSMKTTPADMAKYMMAHLAAGRGPGKAILKPATFELMHRRHTGNHPRQSGFGMIFMTYDYNGERVIEHYGNTGDYRALTLMLLDRGLGVTVMFAGGGAPDEGAKPAVSNAAAITGPVKPGLLHSGLRALVLEHLLGPLARPATAMPTATGDYVGGYRSNRRNYTGPNAAAARGNVTRVEADKDGALKIAGLGPYRQTEKDVFTLDSTLPLEAPFPVSNRYAFSRGPKGEVTAMFSYVNSFAYERVADD